MCTGFWWGNLKERNHLVEIGADGIILKTTFDRYSAMARTEHMK
jgi:hypothetical protein